MNHKPAISMEAAMKSQKNNNHREGIIRIEKGRPESRDLKPFKRLQIVYYLTRNGQLEHPHYMEISHFNHHNLRLKDVLERMSVLRGKSMPFQYSWSCKRSYKNGYVWNDLSENDVIHPVEGAEYVLKGSELLQNEKIEDFSQRQHFSEPNFHSKRINKPLIPHPCPSPSPPLPIRDYCTHNTEFEDGEDENFGIPAPPFCRSNKGVSTDEIAELQQFKPHKDARDRTMDELSLLNHTSPPSTSSTDDSKGSRRRNSLFFNLIACGSGGGSPVLPDCKSKGFDLKKGVAVEEVDEIECMSLNPRVFGKVEKEFFSGSIAESLMENRDSAAFELKKSASYKEERASGIGNEAVAEEVDDDEPKKKKEMMAVKCIPRKNKK